MRGIQTRKGVPRTIYLASIYFKEQIHAPVYGFTKFIMLYVQGSNESESETKVRNYLKSKYNLSPERVTMFTAKKQNPDSYIQLIK
jgi:hypothetical protein